MKMLPVITSCLLSFACYCQGRHAVLITEIMADPTPSAGLPAYEWIELFNTGNDPVNLYQWRLSANGTLSGAFPDLTLAPHQSVIACAVSARVAMEAFGQVIIVPSFPSLDNSGETLALLSADGRTIHAVRYAVSWQENALKKEGGWSLEMIDIMNPCAGKNNWSSSIHHSGGTPGTINSVARVNADILPPVPLRTYSIDPQTLCIVFDAPLDSLNAVNITSYIIDHGMNVLRASCTPPLFEEVVLRIEQPMDPAVIYSIAINDLVDCSQNRMDAARSLKAGIPSAATCVINEILFDPAPGGNDYVEIYNTGPGIIDASQLFIANRNSAGQPGTPARLTNQPFALFPGEYLLITTDVYTLSIRYDIKFPERVLQVSDLPSLPDDKGTVLLLDRQGQLIDEVNYSQRWHHPLISDPEGVAVERLDPAAASSDPANWHSAATTAGYGTPGYVNSQKLPVVAATAQLDIFPRIFSPDNDGRDDLVSFSYRSEAAGFLADLVIFDAGGREVKHLVRNELTGTEGRWSWDGLDEKRQLLPAGIYIVQLDLFNQTGMKKRTKKVLVLARKLN